MVNYVEQATLRIVDQSTKPTRKINNELRKLTTTSKKLSSSTVRDLGRTTREYKSLSRAVADVVAKQKQLGSARLALQHSDIAKTIKQLNDLKLRLDKLTSGKARVIKFDAELSPRLQKLMRYVDSRKKYAINFTTQGDAELQATIDKLMDLDRTLAAVRRKSNVKVNARMNADAYSGMSDGGRNLANILEGTMRNLFHDVAMELRQAILDGFVQSTSRRDVADNVISAYLSGEDDPEAARATAQANVATLAENNTADTSLARQIYAEALTTSKGDQTAAMQAADALLKAGDYISNTQGVSLETALQDVNKLFKAGEIFGRTSNADGSFNAEEFSNFLKIAQQAMVASGGDLTPTMIYDLARNSNAAATGYSDDGLRLLMAIGEEMRTRAAVGWNQLIKQGSGQGQAVYRLDAMEKHGLLTTQNVKTGEYGEDGQPIYERRTKQPINIELLSANPQAWADKYILPIIEELGIDRKDSGKVRAFVDTIIGDRTAAAALTMAVTRGEDFNSTANRAAMVDVESSSQYFDQNSTTQAINEVTNSANEMLGGIGEALEQPIIGGLNAVAEALGGMNDFLLDSQGQIKVTNASIAALGVASGAAAAAWAGTKATKGLLKFVLGGAAGAAATGGAGGVASTALSITAQTAALTATSATLAMTPSKLANGESTGVAPVVDLPEAPRSVIAEALKTLNTKNQSYVQDLTAKYQNNTAAIGDLAGILDQGVRGEELSEALLSFDQTHLATALDEAPAALGTAVSTTLHEGGNALAETFKTGIAPAGTALAQDFVSAVRASGVMQLQGPLRMPRTRRDTGAQFPEGE